MIYIVFKYAYLNFGNSVHTKKKLLLNKKLDSYMRIEIKNKKKKLNIYYIMGRNYIFVAVFKYYLCIVTTEKINIYIYNI